ncbi:MAG: isoleucine--tRNA ligase [Acidimicrobiales bacterium]|nr:isoleucine--tRNA ligase [Acidimicrobiales bacterium]
MAAADQGAYPHVDPRPSFPDLERRVIERWEAERTFEQSVAQRDGAEEFVFYDGPPFANGQPHYGHLLTGFVKDAVPRYQTMRGRKVERRFGWDCHGLPAEQEAEKRLGVMGRKAIEELGVDVFNAECRSLVTGTADSWHSYVTRQARWVDMENDYKTMDPTFMESVMWAFKTLYDKGLAYEGLRVLPYCWECETPLSNFETRMDDAYRDRQDPAITAWVELTSGDHVGKRLLVWTTTPWTLPSNLAVAVGPELTYEVYRDADGHEYVLGTNTVETYEAQLGDAEHVATLPGAELGGADYAPIFDFFTGTENAHRVLVADWVADDEGTGIVHMAPGFGEDDKAACDDAGIPTLVPVDEKGAFTADVPPYAGMQVFDANKEITRDLKERGVLVRHDSYVHSYPHCWRTDTPLIYKAMSSWFVSVTDIKERMLALNQQIDWVPAHVRDGSFGRWLEGARDWSISRNRFWGSPIPVWKSDDPAYPRVDVYGSVAELEADFGVPGERTVTDLHRPMIDELVRPNPDDPTGASMMRRIPDVLDCWFESGSMPFAQVHYPFENQEWFEDHFPGDFICEYIGQTRGWFYTLHVLATALFDKPAFKTCVVHGVLLGDDGQKLSKRLKNYPDPVEVFDTIGSDAMRWSLLSSAAVRGGDMVAAKEPMQDAVRQVLLPIWNAWYFLALYANAGDGLRRGRRVPADARLDHVLDRYVLAKTRILVDDVTDRMDAFDLSGAAAAINGFLDSLNNWYIRRSRERFWGEDQTAIDVLHTVLDDLLRVAAPLLPLLTERVWGDLTGEGSVHLTDWPDPDDLPADPALVETMDRVRGVASAAKSVREARGLRRRLPLRTLTIATADNDALVPFEQLIADEVNVQAIEFVPSGSLGEERYEVDLRSVGKRLGPDTPVVVQAIKRNDYAYDADADELVVHGESGTTFRFGADEYVRKLEADDPEATAALPGGDGLVHLDTDVTPELEGEGLVRDLAREVNDLRRHDGFDVSDRIRLVLDAGHHDDLRSAIDSHRRFLMEATLAVEVVLADDPLREAHRVEMADGRAIHVAVAHQTPPA